MQLRPRRSINLMARECTICGHPDRPAIDHALLNASEGYRSVAKRFGLSEPALFRHRQTHLPALIAKGLAASPPQPSPPAKPREVADPNLENHAAELAGRVRERETKHAREAIDIVAQLRAINSVCLEVLNKARATENFSILLRAVDRIARQIELQARLLGEIQDTTTVNVAVLPEWQGIRLGLLQALKPFPEARGAVIQALKGTET